MEKISNNPSFCPSTKFTTQVLGKKEDLMELALQSCPMDQSSKVHSKWASQEVKIAYSFSKIAPIIEEPYGTTVSKDMGVLSNPTDTFIRDSGSITNLKEKANKYFQMETLMKEISKTV